MRKHVFSPNRLMAAIAFISAVVVGVNAQAQNLDKHFLDVANSGIDYVPTSGYILSGNTFPAVIAGMDNHGGTGGFVLERIQLQKIDNALNSTWFKTYVCVDELGCAHLTDYFTCKYAKHTSDGGYIVCGSVRRDGETSGGTCNPSITYDHMFLLKTDGSGNVSWYRRFASSGQLYSVCETSGGSFIACGYLDGAPWAAPNFALALCVDGSGNLQWAKEAVGISPYPPYNTVGAYFKQVIPFQGRYALIGNATDGMWSNMMIYIFDDLGNNYQDAQLNVYSNHNTLFGNSIVDVGDGDLGITGESGLPCTLYPGFTNMQLMIAKVEPYSLAITFLKYYMNSGSYSYGEGITADNARNRLCVTGLDMSLGTAVYAETDYSGSISRYTNLAAPNAESGLSMTYNTGSNYPVFSGCYGSYTNTFVIKDDLGYDCSGNTTTTNVDVVPTSINEPPVDAPVMQYNDVVYAYDLTPNYFTHCGGDPVNRHAPNGTAAVAKAVGFEIFPNPATDEINLSINDAGFTGGKLTVFDNLGRIAFTMKITDAHAQADISKLLPGLYLVSLESTDGATYHGRFTKY